MPPEICVWPSMLAISKRVYSEVFSKCSKSEVGLGKTLGAVDTVLATPTTVKTADVSLLQGPSTVMARQAPKAGFVTWLVVLAVETAPLNNQM